MNLVFHISEDDSEQETSDTRRFKSRTKAVKTSDKFIVLQILH